jgi:hypothetical protein
MKTRFSLVKDALVRIDNEKRLYNYNDFEDPEIRRCVNIKMDVLYTMCGLCWDLKRRPYFYDVCKRDALYTRYINAIFDNKDNPFSLEHPLLADYIRTNYDRKISRIRISVFTRVYDSPLPESARISAFDWRDVDTQVYMDGKSIRRDRRFCITCFCTTAPVKHDWKNVQLTRVKCNGEEVKYVRRVERVALVLTPKKFAK